METLQVSPEIDADTREEISSGSIHLRGVRNAGSVDLVEPCWRHFMCCRTPMIIRVQRSRRDLFVARVVVFEVRSMLSSLVRSTSAVGGNR